MKRIICALLTVVFLFSLDSPAMAYDKKEHNRYLELVLFGQENYTASKPTSVQSALEALEDASYLAIDQFNSNGSSELSFLRNDYRVPGLPDNIETINFTANYLHRSYTHRGYKYEYIIDKANWLVRKNILLATTEKVFNFKLLSGTILGVDFGYDKKCDSFAALLYYVHILSDHEARASYKVTDVMIPLAQAHVGSDNPDIFSELKHHLTILFTDQKDTHKYKAFMLELDSQAEHARSLAATTGGINSDEKFETFKNQVNDLFTLLEDYVPRLLKEELFFTNVFH